MRIGVPKEIKSEEYRVGITPAGTKELVRAGHRIIVETQAGREIGFTDDDYVSAGAEIVKQAKDVFAKVDLVVKVKEPLPAECAMLSSDHTLFTYLHLAPDPRLAQLLQASQATCIAYETVTDKFGYLPLLAPMSEVAGRLSIQAGAHQLEKPQGGKGVLLGGAAGVPPANVIIIGGGVAGTQAARMALGLGADVAIFDKSPARLRELDSLFNGHVKTVYSTADALERALVNADLVVGAALIPGAQAPKLITRKMLKTMQPGSVLVDIAIDQGGCFETSKPTTHKNPTFIDENVIHYCVANMPGAVARTSTLALTNVTLPYIHELASDGVVQSLLTNPHLLAGLNVYAGKIVSKPVAEALGESYCDPLALLNAQPALKGK